MSFTFIEIPKTGSSSVLKAIGCGYNRRRVKAQRNIFGPLGKTRRHLTAIELRSLPSHKRRNTLAFFRNPYSRIVSEYFFRHLRKPAFKEMTFEEFLCGVRDHQFNGSYRGLIDSKRHLLPQSRFIKGPKGKVIVDFIGRQENLQNDLNGFCKQIKIKEVTLLRRNATKHNHYSKYFTDATRKIVEDVYGEDLEYGKYRFESK